MKDFQMLLEDFLAKLGNDETGTRRWKTFNWKLLEDFMAKLDGDETRTRRWKTFKCC